jgi:uncharacterized protein (TIGR02598 family)
MKNNHFKKIEAGFSLVEVSIAMAIAAIAMVSLIGLIPQGLKTMQDAGDQAIGARIHQQILSEIQLTPFRDKSNNKDLSTSPLRKFHQQIRLYDAQGVELGYKDNGGAFTKGSSLTEAQVEFAWNYSARIWLPEFDSGSTPPSVGGGEVTRGVTGVSNKQTPELLTVIVELVPFQFPGESFSSRLGAADNFFSEQKNFNSIHSYQTTVVRMGMDYTP